MTRHETPFVTDAELIMVAAKLTGPRGAAAGRFVLDTGAALTTIVPELADELGYSARDARRWTKVRSAVGEEDGYSIQVAELAALGVPVQHFDVNVFDLGFAGIDGLLGMNFLRELNYEVRSEEQRIIVERVRRNNG